MCENYEDPLDAVTPEDEALVVLDGAQRPYEWQPTISAARWANHALHALQGPPARLDVIQAYIAGYNQGASDERLRSLTPGGHQPRIPGSGQ